MPFWQAGLGDDWSGPYFGYRTVDFMIGESLLAGQGGHYAKWLQDHHPATTALYQPEAALHGPLDDLAEAWTSAVPHELHYNTWIANRAVEFVKRARPPFLLFVSSPDPHHPFSPPLPWADMFRADDMPVPNSVAGELDRLAPYVSATLGTDWIDNAAPAIEQGGMTITDAVSEESLRHALALTRATESMIDDGYGRVMNELENQGYDADTVVVFTSDHGEFLGQHGLLHKGPPPFGDLCQVSFIAAGPHIPSGEIQDSLTTHLDILPTLADMAGVDRDALVLDGQSLVPLFEGGELQREELNLEYHPRLTEETYNHSLLTRERRLTLYPMRPTWGELFDLEADPGEHHNLFNEPRYKAERDRLIERLTEGFPARPDAGEPLLAKW